MASADVTSDLLHAAGFDDVTFERQDAPICIGRDVEEAVEFALELGPAGELIRLAQEEGQRLRPVVASALREAFSRLQSDSEVLLPASTWIVTARKYGNCGSALRTAIG